MSIQNRSGFRMTSDRSAGRAYSSPLRDRQRKETRRLIVEAVASLVAEGGLHAFSMQDVAARAGVSYASVYRHFPSREALLEGTYEWASEMMSSEARFRPTRLEDLPEWVSQALPLFEAHPEVTQTVLALMGTMAVQPPARRRRDEMIGRLVREDAPALPPCRSRQVAAVLRFLGGSHAWATLRQRFGLDARETEAALRWALETLIRDVRCAGAAGEQCPEAPAP
jgi:AcrR family transcriptional regulator